MVCYQVVARFVFVSGKTGLVSTHIKKMFDAPAYLVYSGLPFGSGLTNRRFFAGLQEVREYAAYLHRVYAGRIYPNPPLPGGQLALF